jgi:glycine/sarcosine N-methyltransferase
MENHGNDSATPREFYNLFADRYDDMIGFPARVAAETETLRPIVTAANIRRAADMGCGTGAHSLALASLGVDVAGIDISPGMLSRARAHAADRQGVRFFEGDFLSPEVARLPRLDAVFCLGNTLPHIPSMESLVDILAYWKSCLRDGGAVILQALNYDRILHERERIVGIRQSGEVTTIRFYDFTDPRITFNILTLFNDQSGLRHALQSTLLTPFTSHDIDGSLRSAGFTRVEVFGSLSREDYTPTSRDAVFIASAG